MTVVAIADFKAALDKAQAVEEKLRSIMKETGFLIKE